MPHPVDVHVGKRIRMRRWMLGQTQQQIADAVGVKFQQVQKYETGANRVSASRLFEIAKTLDTPVSFFFEELEGTVDESKNSVDASADSAPLNVASVVLDENSVGIEQFSDKEALAFLRHYYRLDEEPRRRLFELARSLAKVA